MFKNGSVFRVKNEGFKTSKRPRVVQGGSDVSNTNRLRGLAYNVLTSNQFYSIVYYIYYIVVHYRGIYCTTIVGVQRVLGLRTLDVGRKRRKLLKLKLNGRPSKLTSDQPAASDVGIFCQKSQNFTKFLASEISAVFGAGGEIQISIGGDCWPQKVG